jgi:hypothetical protein
MRIVAVVLLGALIACGGEVSDDKPAQPAPKEKSEQADDSNARNAAPNAAAAPSPSGGADDSSIGASGTSTQGEPNPYYAGPADAGPPSPPAQSSSTPLVLSFDGKPVTFAMNAGEAFALTTDGQCHGSDWPTAATPWLAFDRNGNGAIDDGSELFGSAVRLANGALAKNGFEALRELDANRDNVFDAADPAFGKVVVWTDRNGDRRSTPTELMSLAEAGVRSISLADTRDMRCDTRGNCEGERAAFTLGNGQRGTVIDVYLRTR